MPDRLAPRTVHGFPGYKPKKDFPSTIEVLEGEGNTPVITVDTIPGSMWRYSGGGYTIMQKVIKDVSGMELHEYSAKHIFPKIGMSESTFEQPISESYHAKVSAAYDGNGKIYKGVWHNYPEVAAAGLWTTPSDLIKYCLHIQQVYNGAIEGVLSQDMITQMLTPDKNNWGLGPALQNPGDSTSFGHGGKNAGFTNNMFAYTHEGSAIIVMTNGDNGNQIIQDVFRAVSEIYDWGLLENDTVKVMELEEDALDKFTGIYALQAGERLIKIKAKVKNGQLIVSDPGIPEPLKLTPLGDASFVDLKRGTYIDFTVDDKEEVSRLVWNKRWTFSKKP